MENSNHENLQPTLPRMKIFQVTRKNLAAAGISPNLSFQPYPFNERIVCGFLALIFYIICNVVYLFYEAITFTEYTRSIYMASVAALIIFVLLIFILNVKELFEFINKLENNVNTSE